MIRMAAILAAAVCLLAWPAMAQSINQRLITLQARQATLEAAQGALAAQIAALANDHAAVVTLQTNYAALSATVAALANDHAALTTLTTRVDGIGAQVAALGAWKLNAAAALADLQARMNALEGLGPQASLRGPPVQLGLTALAYYDAAQPFLNDALSFGQFEAFYAGGAAATQADIAAAGVLNADTLLPTSMGPFDKYFLGFFGWAGNYIPADTAGVWVIEWAGTADISFVYCAHSNVTVTDHRIELTRSSATYNSGCGVFARNVGSDFAGLHIFRKNDEAAFRAGATFRTQFKNHLARYDIIRTLDWQGAQPAVRRTAKIRTLNAYDMGARDLAFVNSTAKAYSVPPRLMVRLAVETGTALWTLVPPFLGAPSGLDSCWPLSYPDNANCFKAQGQAGIAGQIASGEFDAYADLLVTALVAENYPTTRKLYLELGNEVWNFAGGFGAGTNYYWGASIALGDNGTWPPARYGYGYTAARFAKAFSDALARAGRSQEWTMVIAGQAANPTTTTAALTGYRDYFTAIGAQTAPWMAKAGVATASYFSGAFEIGGAFSPPSGTSMADFVLAEIARDRAGTLTRVADWLISDATTTGYSIPWTIARRNEHQAIALSFGAAFIGDYEGEAHEQGVFALHNNATYQAFMGEFFTGAQGARVTAAWAAALKAQNANAIMANYSGPGFGLHRFNGTGGLPYPIYPWTDCYYGDACARETALSPYLKAAP